MKQYNNYQPEDLTFVVCAYGECKYLEEAVYSLLNQTKKAHILISTSTDITSINKIANKYNIEVRINPDGGQIKDYNFAMAQPNTKLIMLMHQDEIIEKTFVEKILYGLNHAKDPIIAFTDYIEIHNDIVDKEPSKMVKIKRLMLRPARLKKFMHTKFGKRFIQRFGNPITHPTVVCVKNKMPREIFREEYKSSMDWDLWERLTNVKGSFVFINEVLLYHRMNEDNQSAKLLQTTNIRYEDELNILERFWPKSIAKFLMKFYKNAYKNY